jgi:hypothetical protein
MRALLCVLAACGTPFSTPGEGDDVVGVDGGTNSDDASTNPGDDAAVDASLPQGQKVAVVVGYGTRRARSLDGVTWTNFVQVTPNGGDDNDLLRGVGWGNGTFVAVGGASIGITMTSTDGTTWTNEIRTHDAWVGNVAYLGGVFIAAGGNGLRMRSTNNGATWSDGVGYQALHYRDVATNGAVVAAVGHTYDTTPNLGYIATTTDGITWTERRRIGAALNRVAAGNGIFVAGGNGNAVLRSTDGVTWTEHALGASPNGGDVSLAFDGNEFVASANGSVFRSPDGMTWTAVPGGSGAPVAYIDGRFLSLGWPASITSSQNLTSWTPAFSPGGSGFTKIAIGVVP